MNERPNSVEQRLANEFSSANNNEEQKYNKLGIKFNPFPKSGTSNTNSSDYVNAFLQPVNEEIDTQVFDYLARALALNQVNENDKFISGVVLGNYGSGKTQLLMYVKYLLGLISQNHLNNKNPYVIYIDNPGVKLSELIGSIIDKIGEENLKKYLWHTIRKVIESSESFKTQLKKFENKNFLFEGHNPDPWTEENKVSHKAFIDAWYRGISIVKDRKEFDKVIKDIILEIFRTTYKHDSTLSQYFYEIISSDLSSNNTFELFTQGSTKHIENREVRIITTIVEVIKEQGFTDFFILVDEFEDITRGRLGKTQVDNYLYNLRTLVDEHRAWCILIAMVDDAFEKLSSISPPLAERLATIQIKIPKLNSIQAQNVVANYLKMAKPEEDTDIFKPFEVEAINLINDKVDGSTRRLLTNCFALIEKIVSMPNNIIINKEFVENHIQID